MSNPNRPSKEDLRGDSAWRAGCLGVITGGIVLPLGFAFYAALVLRDMGGPLFWPILAISGAVIGVVVSIIVDRLMNSHR